MGVWVDQLQPIVEALSKKHGSYDEKTPRMNAPEMLAIIALYSGRLPVAIDRIMSRVVRSDFVTKDGLFTSSADLMIIATLDEITSARYLFNSVQGTGQPAWRRVPAGLSTAQINKARVAGIKGEITYEPARNPSELRDNKLEHIYFLRESINAYQAASDQISAAVPET